MGKIEAISMKNSGIKLEGEDWKTVVGKAANYLSQYQKGDEVQTKESNGKVTFIGKKQGPQQSAQQPVSPKVSTADQYKTEDPDQALSELSQLMEHTLDSVAALFNRDKQELTDEQIRVANTLFIQVTRKLER